jgi:hypothetical protein
VLGRDIEKIGLAKTNSLRHRGFLDVADGTPFFLRSHWTWQKP